MMRSDVLGYTGSVKFPAIGVGISILTVGGRRDGRAGDDFWHGGMADRGNDVRGKTKVGLWY